MARGLKRKIAFDLAAVIRCFGVPHTYAYFCLLSTLRVAMTLPIVQMIKKITVPPFISLAHVSHPFALLCVNFCSVHAENVIVLTIALT